MKKGKSILTRCLALALALVLIASSASLGTVLKVFAAAETSVNISDLVVKNYNLTDAEKDLIMSGNLVDEKITYVVFNADEVNVNVDTDTKTITAPEYNGWKPVSAQIVVGTEVKEDVSLANGVGTYGFDGNAFAVRVAYKLEVTANATVQAAQLNAAAALVEGKSNIDTARTAGLDVVVNAIDTLDFLVDGIDLGFVTVKFDADAAAAVSALEAEIAKNGGKLNVQVHNDAYAAAESKIEYLIENGASYKAAIISTYNNLKAIQADKLVNGDSAGDIVDSYLEKDDAENGTKNYELWGAFKSGLESAIGALSGPAAAEWAILNGDYLAKEPDYTELDALVAALGTPKTYTVVNPLLVEEASAQANLSMFNVNVEIVLNQVEDKVNSNKLEEIECVENLVVMGEGSTKADIEAEVKNILDAFNTEWADVIVNCDVDFSDLPATLTEDITYTITYNPMTIKVTTDYAGETEVYYGYQLELPAHTDAEQAYDYTVNENSYIQGDVIVITEATMISRIAGKAYTFTDLYTEVGNYFGNSVAQGILSSGALTGNEDIYVRVLDQNEANQNGLLTLDGNDLSATVYNGWIPYAYGASGNVSNVFGAGYTGTWVENTAYIKYSYDLSQFNPDYRKETTEAVMTLAETLKKEADGQLSALAALDLNEMANLNYSMVNILSAAIGGADFTPGDGNKNDNYTVAMRAHFNTVLAGVAKECIAMDTYDQNLKLYDLMSSTAGKDDSLVLKNYYSNSEAILSELEVLVKYLNMLLEDDATFTAAQKEAAMVTLCGLVQGYEDYADRIVKLKDGMNKVLTDLTAPNAAIDMTSANLNKLVDALVVEGDVVATQDYATPYMLSGELSAMNSAFVNIQVTLVVNGKTLSQTVACDEIGKGDVMDAATIETLKSKITAAAKAELGEVKYGYYSLSTSHDLDALKDQPLNATVYATYTYSPIPYTIKIDGEVDQIVSAENLNYTLPEHPDDPATVYYYYLNGEGERIEHGEYKLTLAELGNKTFTRQAVNEAEASMLEVLDKLNANTSGNVYTPVKNEEGTTVKLIADVAGTQGGIMSFATDMALKGYSYIGLNGEPLLYTIPTENGTSATEVSLQTLINAMMADTSFGSQTLIDLGSNNGGKVLTATMQLGTAPDKLYYTDLEFVLNLNGVPGKMVTVANGLNAVKNNMSFKTASDEELGNYMDVQLHLPEKVYEVYLTALWGAGELDKSDVNAINNQIAFNFLYDYIMLVAESDVNAATFQNTLDIFDAAANEVLDKDIPDYDLTQYDEYLQLVKKALTSVQINANEKDTTITVTGQGKHILTLVDAIGLDISSYETLLGMVKEFKDGEVLTGTVKATLDNLDTDFEALIVDVDAAVEGAKEIKNIDNRYEAVDEAKDLVKGLGIANGIDYTADLSERVKAENLTGKAVIFLLKDIEDTLVLNDTTIIDLNGKKVTEIVANGHVYIMDSTLDTLSAGTVETVSGNLTIVAGNYGTDVSAYLPDGYKQVGDNVQNALYTISSPDRGDLNFTVNTDVMYDESVDGYLPSVRALAVDMAADIALNYYMTAMLKVDGNEIVNIDFDDVIGIIDRTETATEAINEVLCMFNAEGTSNFINTVSDDLLNFAAIESAINSDEKVASYELTVAPYGFELYHNTVDNYLTFNVGSVDSKAQKFEISLTLDGKNKEKVAKIAGELDSIVVAEDTYAHVYLDQPTYSNRTLWLSGKGEASLYLDLSKESKFQTIIAVILAYGNPDKAEDLVNAIGNEDELKAVFNEISVEEVFTALKELEREISFNEMAESLNVQINYADAAAYENYFHVLLAAAGYALERLDITGYTDKTMGMIEVDESGRYMLSYSPDAHGDITRRGFTVDATAVVEEAILSVKIFGKTEEEPDCLWGDVNHDGSVDSRDACLILQYDVREGDLSLLDYDGEFCLVKADVTADGLIDSRDACLILQRDVNPETVFPAEG